MKVADYIDRVELVNKCLSLLDKESEKLNERETIRKIITSNIPKEWERDYIPFERRVQGQDPKSGQDNFEDSQEGT